MRTYLERDGFAVVTAADGPAALEAIERHRPALVVLDLMLPELDGRAVIRAVRGDDDAAATPILIVSARGSTLDRIAGLEDGADDYLPKPFSPAELVLRVKSILADRPPPPSTTRRAVCRCSTPTSSSTSTATKSPAPVSRSAHPSRVPPPPDDHRSRRPSPDPRPVLDAVYGRDQADVMDRTVDVHIGRLREKLGDDAEAPRYVATVRGFGYRAARA